MHRSISLSSDPYSMARYEGVDLKEFCGRFGCDGLELAYCDDNFPDAIKPEIVNGVHLGFYCTWVDFWNGNTEAVLREFNDFDTVERFFGGTRPEILVKNFVQNMDFAQSVGAKYVVFHVSDCTLKENFTFKFEHTDEQVIDASCELINAMLSGRDYTFDFLVENLWCPGLRLTSPALTRRLMDEICYDKKGIMLDTGHFMLTNTQIKSQEQGLKYINEMLDAHGDLCRYIKGVHLHQSVTGDYVEEVAKNPPKMEREYFDRFAQAYRHISAFDTHSPMTCDGVSTLVERISPKYLTHELANKSQAEYEQALKAQSDATHRA